MKDGRLTCEKGFGRAHLEYDVPLEDEIRKYLPELPDYGARITIRNLLQHTGGIRDQWQTLALAGWRLNDVITQKQILSLRCCSAGGS